MLLDKVKHILCISLILLVGVTTLYACKSDDKELQGEPVLQVQKSIGFKKEGGEVAVPVKSNREWNASVTEGKEWLTARKASDTELTVSATSSPEKGVREGNITIANNALTAKLRVVQTGGDLIIEVAEESRVIQVAGTGNDHLEVNLLSNTDYEVVIPEEAKDWITEKEVPDTRADLASSTRIFSIASNPLTTERNATIKFVSKENTNIYDQSEIKQQKKSSDISGVNPEKDIKLKVTGGYDTDHQPGQDISKSYDGQFGGTCYHSTWSQSAKFPVTLEYQFDQNQLTLDYILYHSRNGNGNFGAFELYIKPQGSTDFIHIQDYDFKGAGVRNSGESPGRFQRKHHQEAPADQLHRNSDCYDHASDSVIHLHGELLKLPGTGSKRPHAVSGQPCQRGLKRSAELSVSSVCPGSDDFHYHSEL